MHLMSMPSPFIVAGGGADCHLHVFCGDRFILFGKRCVGDYSSLMSPALMILA